MEKVKARKKHLQEENRWLREENEALNKENAWKATCNKQYHNPDRRTDNASIQFLKSLVKTLQDDEIVHKEEIQKLKKEVEKYKLDADGGT